MNIDTTSVIWAAMCVLLVALALVGLGCSVRILSLSLIRWVSRPQVVTERRKARARMKRLRKAHRAEKLAAIQGASMAAASISREVVDAFVAALVLRKLPKESDKLTSGASRLPRQLVSLIEMNGKGEH